MTDKPTTTNEDRVPLTVADHERDDIAAMLRVAASRYDDCTHTMQASAMPKLSEQCRRQAARARAYAERFEA